MHRVLIGLMLAAVATGCEYKSQTVEKQPVATTTVAAPAASTTYVTPTGATTVTNPAPATTVYTR